jgi:hypothetical protein
MPQGVRLPKDQLTARYRISERLAARVGALLSRGVELSGAVLESAPPASPAEALLLHPDVLAQAGRLETADLAGLAKTVPGAGSVPPLVVVSGEGRQVVALEEELLAESAWPSAAQAGTLREVAPSALIAGGGGGPLSGAPGPGAFRPDEAQGLFTPDALAQLKLTILTGVDPSAKTEAVRKLAYAPLDAEEKSRLCLRALAEEHPGVRREAALLLRTLGIAPEVSETIAGLSEGEPEARKMAMAHVAALQSRVTPAEQLVLLAVLLAVIREEKDAELVTEALGALASFGPRAAADRELLDRVLRLLLPLLAGDAPLGEPAADTLLAIGAAGPAAAGSALWAETQSAKDPPLRRRLLRLLARLPSAPGSPVPRRDLAAALARELGQGTDSDPLCRQLAVDAIALGVDAAEALVEAFPAARAEQWPFLVKVIDDVATADGTPPSVREPVGAFFVRTWRNGDRILRLALLSTRLPVDPSLPPPLRRELAACFLADLHDAGFPHVAEATEEAIRDMGADVLPVVRDAIGASVHAAERETAVRLYARILRDAQEGAMPAGAPSLAEATAFLRGLEDGSRCAPGTAARALGVLLSGPLAPPELVAEVTSDFRRRLVRAAAAEDMICALGWIASGPRANAALRIDLLVLVVELLMRATADAPVTQTRTDDGIRLEFNADASRRTDFIRELILAARRILVASTASTGLPPGLRERAVRRMIEKWAAVSDYAVIWAPSNVNDLAEALGEIAAAPGLPVPLRVDVLGGLLLAARSIPVIRILGRACTWEGDDGAPPDPAAAAAFGKRCREVADRFLSMIQHADYSDPEDQDVLLEAVGRLSVATFLGADAGESEVARRRLATCLFDGLTHGHRRAREALEALAGSPRIAEPLRAEIRERLGGIRGFGRP